ncbi:site-specific integrase [Pseudoalteromonas sp. SWYJ118]|uniref:integrase n=1 Tax=Pseudoalteromonas sp. SWYJ118 TaxID=2792062 RepID=UPI0018CF26CC|nr:site-specific integrase [Pseudoalteromonas sp. SWYJ118]MBH0074036.1 site-specific integrase [Pseudoalteromonas sp. SWYJ118]
MASMSIEQRKSKDGKSKFRVKVRHTQNGKKIEEKSETFLTRKLANSWGEKARKEIELRYSKMKAGTFREEDNLKEATVGELIDLYLRLHDPDEPKDPNDTRASVEPLGRTKVYVLKSLLHYPISSILASNLRADDIITHCKSRTNESTKPKPQTVFHDVTYLHTVMQSAKSIFKINANLSYHTEAAPLLKKFRLIGKSVPRTDKKPTDDQLQLMRKGLKERQEHPSAIIPYLDILDISLLTAMRISEITRVRWDDFDFDKKTLTIRERKDPDPNEKSRKHSVIPLIDDAPDIIARQKRSTDPEKCDLIFPYNSRSVTAGWQRVRKDLGIGDIRYHDLRRKGLSDMASRGVPLLILSKISGHKSINILHNIYLNLDMENFDIDSFTPALIKK